MIPLSIRNGAPHTGNCRAPPNDSASQIHALLDPDSGVAFAQPQLVVTAQHCAGTIRHQFRREPSGLQGRVRSAERAQGACDSLVFSSPPPNSRSESTSNGFNNGTALGSKSALGLSFWAAVNLQSDLAVVARYDNYDPNTDDKSKGDLRNLIIGGLEWKVDKNVSITPNIYYETYEAPTNGSAPSAAVVGRVTLYWVFL